MFADNLWISHLYVKIGEASEERTNPSEKFVYFNGEHTSKQLI